MVLPLLFLAVGGAAGTRDAVRFSDAFHWWFRKRPRCDTGDPDLKAISADAFDEKRLYKGAVFFGHQNTDADSVASAYGAAALYRGIPACPMTRAKCPNAETAFLMRRLGVATSEVPVLAEIPKLDTKKFVLVDFNEVSKGPPGMPELAGQDGVWNPERVLGAIDHHAIQQAPLMVTATPQLLYGYFGSIITETHAFGSACTIIAMKFKCRGKTPSREVAGMLIGGILSDTLGLTGPTTTPYDSAAVEFLQPLSRIEDTAALYEEMAIEKCATVLTDPLEEVFDSDLKAYKVLPDQAAMLIGVVEVANAKIYDDLLARSAAEAGGAMDALRGQYRGKLGLSDSTALHVFVVVVSTKDKQSTVITNEEGAACIAQRAMGGRGDSKLPGGKECRPGQAGVEAKDAGVAFIPGGTCVSRKSQIQPTLGEAVKAHAAGSLQCG